VTTTFKLWWAEFSREYERDVYLAAKRLKVYVDKLSGEVRTEFLGELAAVVCKRGRLYDAAASVLESTADGSVCELLHGHLNRLTRADLVQQEQEATIIRILARARPATYVSTVTAFLFSKPVGMYFSSVIWTQWPDHPALFGRANVRFLRFVSPESVAGTAVIQAFLYTPDALAAVRVACIGSDDRELWGRIAAAVRNTTLPHMTESKERAIARILEDSSVPG
jgi:hypothetical protein